jgi:hypothetical protein
MKSASYLQEKNFPTKNIQEIEVSTSEIEFSIKQVFKIKLLYEKIYEKLVPIAQIIDHLDTKRAKATQVDTIHKSLTVSLNSLYISLINEISDSEQFAPVFSLESKLIQFTK